VKGGRERLVVLVIILGALALSLFLFAPAQLGGSTTYTSTVGDSMEPMFHKGDLAVIRPASTYKVGDIVLYESPVLQRPVLHRIIVIQNGHYFFKGDHNDFVDPGYATRSELLGKLWVRIPKAGTALSFIGKPQHSAALAGLAVLFLAFPGSRRRRRRRGKGKNVKDRKALHLHRPRHPAEDILTVALLAGMALAVAVAFTTPLKHTVQVPGAYRQSGTFAYSAPVVKPSAAYPGGFASTGEPLFIQDIKTVTIRYAYRFASQLPHGVLGTIGLSALFSSDSSSWHHTYVLSKARPFRGDKATIRDTFPLQGLTTLVTQLAVASGSPSQQYDIVLQPTVHVHGFVDGKSIDTTFAPTLPFTLAGPTLKLNPAVAPVPLGATYGQPSAAENLAAATNPSASGSIPGLAGNEIAVDGHPVPVADLRGLGLGLAALALLVLLTWPMRRRRDRWTPEQHLAARQGCVIVDVVALEGERARTWVPDFAGLVAFARYLERPILHDLQTGTFATEDGGRLYVYRPAPAADQPAPQSVAFAAEPKRKGVRLRWLGAGLAVAVVAGVVVSFTAANVVPLTNAGVRSDTTSLSELTPSECAGMGLTRLVVAPTGTATGTAANSLILDASTTEKGTLTGGAGNDCIVSGAVKETLDGGGGTGDICIGTGAGTKFKNCEATYTSF
jgi:signal peptidase I